jgi:NADPH:quinone reductase-like Zn-dependent oxidoreductase
VPVRWPVIPGSDFSGEIIAIDDPDGHFKTGDRVSAHYVQAWRSGPPQADYVTTNLGLPGPGVFAGLIQLPVTGLLAIPDDMSDEAAATFAVAGVSAWNCLMENGFAIKDKTVLIQGTGGVALFALQIAHAAGAHPLVLTSGSAKAELAKRLGAGTVINYRQYPDWELEVMRVTGGQGAGVIVEVTGGDNLQRSIEALATGGVISSCGFLSGMQATIALPRLFFKSATLRGVRVGSRQHHCALLEFYRAQALQPVIDRRYPFAELKQAFAALERQQHSGKIVVTVDPGQS